MTCSAIRENADSIAACHSGSSRVALTRRPIFTSIHLIFRSFSPFSRRWRLFRPTPSYAASKSLPGRPHRCWGLHVLGSCCHPFLVVLAGVGIPFLQKNHCLHPSSRFSTLASFQFSSSTSKTFTTRSTSSKNAPVLHALAFESDPYFLSQPLFSKMTIVGLLTLFDPPFATCPPLVSCCVGDLMGLLFLG